MTQPRGRGPAPGSINQSYLVATAILAGSIFVAASIAAVGLDDDDESAAPPTTSTTAPVETTTTVAVPTTVAGPTTTVPGTTTTTRPTTTTTRASTATTAPPQSACGSGTVAAQPRSGPLTSDGSGYHLPVRAEVTSSFDRDVELLRLVLRVTFADGSTTDVTVDTAGVSVAPQEEKTLSAGTVDSQQQPTKVEVASFSYQPAGKPECATST